MYSCKQLIFNNIYSFNHCRTVIKESDEFMDFQAWIAVISFVLLIGIFIALLYDAWKK